MQLIKDWSTFSKLCWTQAFSFSTLFGEATSLVGMVISIIVFWLFGFLVEITNIGVIYWGSFLILALIIHFIVVSPFLVWRDTRPQKDIFTYINAFPVKHLAPDQSQSPQGFYQVCAGFQLECKCDSPSIRARAYVIVENGHRVADEIFYDKEAHAGEWADYYPIEIFVKNQTRLYIIE